MTSLPDANDLEALLRRIDGRPYPAYRDLPPRTDLGDGFRLAIDRVQGDPFAAPSALRLRVDAELPEDLRSGLRREAAEDELLRAFAAQLPSYSQSRGSGRSGSLSCQLPSQAILERTGCRILPDGTVEYRLRAGLPARGRSVLGRQAAEMLLQDLPDAADAALESCPDERLAQVADHHEDQAALREQLRARGLVGFIADGSILPRRSGVDDRPMKDAVPFHSPDELRVTLTRPHGAPLTGMGIPQGVTLIVGGGYHGKSTLLAALRSGVANHRAGDGRHHVVSDPDTVQLRAEDRRSVSAVDISPFISNLPVEVDTRRFSTADASGSTSQAAALMEALEAGARVLLFDEDTCATNFMQRDARMQALVAAGKEPITPLIDRVRSLWEEQGVSTVLVMGSSGDWFEVADTVIMLDGYRAHEVTAQARALVAAQPSQRTPRAATGWPALQRAPSASSLSPLGDRGRPLIRARGRDELQYGESEIDLRHVEGFLELGQVAAVGEALAWLGQQADGGTPLAGLLDDLDELLDDEGVDALAAGGTPFSGMVRPRRHEVAAALNRLRALQIADGG